MGTITMRRPLLHMNTRLADIPEDWLRNAEKHIMRGSFLPCWIWTGAHDMGGYPVVNHPQNGKMLAQRWIASMFWDFPQEFFVTRTCLRQNCVNPQHLVVQEENPRWSVPLGKVKAIRSLTGRS
jgi:hypothetical protein